MALYLDPMLTASLTYIFLSGRGSVAGLTIGHGQPDQGQPDQGQPDQGQPDQGQPDQCQPDQGQPDQGQPDQGQPDQGRPDQEPPPYRLQSQVDDAKSGERKHHPPPPAYQPPITDGKNLPFDTVMKTGTAVFDHPFVPLPVITECVDAIMAYLLSASNEDIRNLTTTASVNLCSPGECLSWNHVNPLDCIKALIKYVSEQHRNEINRIMTTGRNWCDDEVRDVSRCIKELLNTFRMMRHLKIQTFDKFVFRGWTQNMTSEEYSMTSIFKNAIKLNSKHRFMRGDSKLVHDVETGIIRIQNTGRITAPILCVVKLVKCVDWTIGPGEVDFSLVITRSKSVYVVESYLVEHLHINTVTITVEDHP
jgi:hypothetical protein